jgi:hypothetical protein
VGTPLTSTNGMSGCGETTVRTARDSFLRQSNLGPDGGYAAATVAFHIGPITLRLPNTSSRRRALPLHDLHHVITGFDSSWRGEAQIAAWELASGCSGYGAAWTLNLMALPIGLVLSPVRTWRAFRRGRLSDNLYRVGWQDGWLDESVGSLRSRVRLDACRSGGPAGDAIRFAMCAVPGLLGAMALAAAVVAVWRAIV